MTRQTDGHWILHKLGRVESLWHIMTPLLSNPTYTPLPANIAYCSTAFRELMQIRYSSQLFRMPTFKEVQQNLIFLNLTITLNWWHATHDRRFRPKVDLCQSFTKREIERSKAASFKKAACRSVCCPSVQGNTGDAADQCLGFDLSQQRRGDAMTASSWLH